MREQHTTHAESQCATELPIAALIYDFDGTLAPGNMQEYSFIEAIGEDKEQFWEGTRLMSEAQDSDNVLVYMLSMLEKARQKGLPITRESLRKWGESITFFKGVESWFKRIAQYGLEEGVQVEHYINSSGLKEIVEGTGIASEFKALFACSYYYDAQGNAMWPASAVNYTNKTQFLFKINKGIFSIGDAVKINESIPEEEKRVPFNNMIYFGDGETDVPCMKLVRQMGGSSIAVYEPGNKKKEEIARTLFNQNRVDFFSPADYSAGSELESMVKAILSKIKADDTLHRHRRRLREQNLTKKNF